MKRLFIIFGLLGFMLMSAVHVKGQDNEICEFNLNDIQALKNGQDVHGYYLFYKAKKQKGKEILYHLQILDKNAEVIAENDIVGSKDLHLIKGMSNGSNIAFKFYDMKEDLEIIKIYDQQAKELRSIKVELEKNQQKMMKMSINANTPQMHTLFAVEGKGFVNSRMLLNGFRFGYEVQYISNDQSEGWVTTSDEKQKESQSMLFIGNTDDVLYFVKANGAKADETRIVGLSITDGKEKFESGLIDIYTDDRLVLNFFFKEETQEMFSLGLYDEKKDKGILFTKYDMQGKVLEESKINWKDELSDLEKKGSIFFHDLQKDESGNYRVVGEHFQLNSKARLVIGDLFIFELNEDLTLKKAEKFPKEENKYQLGEGSITIGGPSMKTLGIAGNIGNYMQWFDFSHIVSTPNSFEAFFANNTKNNQKGDNSLIRIALENGKYEMHTKVIATGPDMIRMLPSTERSVLLFEYFKKQKELKKEFIDIN